MTSKTSWESSEEWYDKIVGKEGHFYHQEVVLPGVLKLLNFEGFSNPSLLDLACGQGVLARKLPKEIPYTGIDLSPSLIQAAKRQGKGEFLVADICKPLPLKECAFTHATILLALQNVAFPDRALKHLSPHIQKGGELVIVLNHPCFRIPRQSGWEIDEKQGLQFRRINRYLSPMKIPIQMHPGSGKKSEQTWSFHYPLSYFSRWLSENGFAITHLEEWTSPKKSTGKRAKMENLARSEFPLFLAIKAVKIL